MIRLLRVSVGVALVPWLLAALWTVLWSPVFGGRQTDDNYAVHGLFQTPFVLLPVLVFGTSFGLLLMLHHRDLAHHQRNPWALGAILAAMATVTLLVLATVLDGEYGFGLAAIWAFLSGYSLLSFVVGGLLCRRYPTQAASHLPDRHQGED
jgi:hypothetical protein